MKGRMEHEKQVNKKIESLICDYPNYLKDFNISMDAEGLTHNTRLTYMKGVISYLNYLRDDDKDIFDENIFKDINAIQIKKYFVSIRYKDMDETDGEKIEKSGSFINVQQRALSFFFRFLMESEIITKNPLRVDGQPIKIGKPKDSHTPIALDQSETEQMYKNIENGVGSHQAQAHQAEWRERDLAMIDLALNSGLRVSALTEINVSDIDFKAHTIDVIEKGNKASKIEIDSQSEDLLKKWIKRRKKLLGGVKTDALFISNRRKRISQNSVRALVTKYSTGINKHITPHKLRSTFATAVMLETGSEHVVQTALGHNGSVTDRYLGNKEEEKRTAIGAARRHYMGDNVVSAQEE